MEGVLTPPVPLCSMEWHVGWVSVGHSTVEGAPNKRLQQVSGLWGRFSGEVKEEGLGVEKSWELSQSGEKWLQGCPSSHHKDASVGDAWRGPLPKPQIKRPRNEGTGAMKANMPPAWLAEAWVLDCNCPQIPQCICYAPSLVWEQQLFPVRHDR